mgnify:CR=1 FL=1
MKTTTRLIFAGALLAASSAPLVAAAAVNVDVNIGLPGFTTYAPAPVYYYPPAVVYSRPYVVERRDWYRDRRHEWERHHRFDERRHW